MLSTPYSQYSQTGNNPNIHQLATSQKIWTYSCNGRLLSNKKD